MQRLMAVHGLSEENRPELLAALQLPPDHPIFKQHFDQSLQQYPSEVDIQSPRFQPGLALDRALERDGQVRLPVLARPLSSMNKWWEKVVEQRPIQ